MNKSIFPCPFEGCGMVLSRGYELNKHKAAHEDPGKLFHCNQCSFSTLDRRNLPVHVATHTGEKIHKCPDTITEQDTFGSLVEKRCDYETNDRSLLTKHRKRNHGYIPHPRATRQRGSAFTFIACPPPFASRVSKPKRGEDRPATAQRPKPYATRVADKANDSATGDLERATSDISSPSPASRKAVHDQEQPRPVHVQPPIAAGSGSATSSSVLSLASAGAHDQWTYVALPDATSALARTSSDATPFVGREYEYVPPETRGHSVDVASSHVAGPSSAAAGALLAPGRCVSLDELFDPSANVDWSAFFDRGIAISRGPALDLFRTDTFATGGFGSDLGLTGPGVAGWGASSTDHLWSQF